MRRWIAGAAIGLTVMTGARGVRAQQNPDASAPTEVRWQAPAGCPSEEEIRLRLQEALPAGHAALTVEVTVEPGSDDQLQATVLLRGAWGKTTRMLDSPTCETLANAVVLLASVSVHGELPDPERPPVPEPQSELREEPTSEETVGVSVSRDLTEQELAAPGPSSVEPLAPVSARSRGGPADALPREQPRPRGLLRIEARAGAGVLPEQDVGAAIALGLGRGRFRAELGGSAWLPRERAFAPDASIRVGLWTAEARACFVGRLAAAPWLTPLVCGGIELGALRGEGRGEGLDNTKVATRAWTAATLRPSLAIQPWRHLGFVLGGSLVVPLRQLRFTTGQTEEIYRPAPVAARGFFGVEVHFP